MSRTTQFVGLTTAASSFTDTLEALDRYVGAQGMFGEDIELGRWRDPYGNSYTEVVQDDPWSSGPCIFTCLEMRWANKDSPSPPSKEALGTLRSWLTGLCDGSTITSVVTADKMLALLDACLETRLFEWTIDPTLRDKAEWDYDRGAYWI